MNVDIRVIVDVTQGAVDLYLSPNDSSFVVSVNSSNGDHAVELDPTYHKHEPSRRMPSFDEHVPEEPRVTWYYDKIEYTLADYTAKDLATYVTVDRRNILLRVRNLRNRLVLTLPQNVHDLTHTKFYIVIRARHTDDAAASFGVIFFRQDQLHIDLFVFFSVFFSCFFLFLAACVVAWKAKQAADVRRARRRHVVEVNSYSHSLTVSNIILIIYLNSKYHYSQYVYIICDNNEINCILDAAHGEAAIRGGDGDAVGRRDVIGSAPPPRARHAPGRHRAHG